MDQFGRRVSQSSVDPAAGDVYIQSVTVPHFSVAVLSLELSEPSLVGSHPVPEIVILSYKVCMTRDSHLMPLEPEALLKKEANVAYKTRKMTMKQLVEVESVVLWRLAKLEADTARTGYPTNLLISVMFPAMACIIDQKLISFG